MANSNSPKVREPARLQAEGLREALLHITGVVQNAMPESNKEAPPTMRRMLVVDDEQDTCDCLKDYFSAHGFSVGFAFSGEEALKRLTQEAADVILLDILLPGLSGIEVLKRAKELCPNARIIMVTALDELDLRMQARRYGAAGYITKPFNFSSMTWSAVLC